MSDAEHERPRRRARFPLWFDVLFVLCVLLILTVLYVVVLHVAVGGDNSAPPNEEDALYFGIHGAMLTLSLLVAWGIAALSRRSTMALLALFGGWFLVAMMAAQIATFELACHGHNDIIRHWQCIPESSEQ
ncbi:MAG: hypothetical protein U5Q44_09840 [Dehalococcoidia bacterium]|nr:hypothetical protein [Dehalococcoidia bacterium]